MFISYVRLFSAAACINCNIYVCFLIKDPLELSIEPCDLSFVVFRIIYVNNVPEFWQSYILFVLLCGKIIYC